MTAAILAGVFICGCCMTGPQNVPADYAEGMERAQKYFREKKFVEARGILEGLRVKYPRDRDVISCYIVTFMIDKRYDECIRALEQALTTDNENTLIMYCLGAVYDEAGRLPEAKAVLQKALYLGDDSIELLSILAEIEFKTRDVEKSAVHYDAAISKLRAKLDASGAKKEDMISFFRFLDKFILARAEIAANFEKDLKGAERLIKEYLGRNPKAAYMWELYLSIIMIQGEAERALAILEEAVAKDGDFLLLNILRGNVLFSLNRIEEAHELLRYLETRYPDAVEMLVFKTQCFIMDKNLEGADAVVSDAMKKHPKNLALVRVACEVYMAKREYDRIFKLLDERAASAANTDEKKEIDFLRKIISSEIERMARGGKNNAPEPAVDLKNFSSLGRADKANVLKALIGSREPRHIELFFAAADDNDSVVRVYAVNALVGALEKGKETSENGLKIVERIENAFKDGEENVRAAAVAALAGLDLKDGAAKILPMLEDESSYVRETADRELMNLTGKRVGFDPAGSAENRAEAVKKWHALIESGEK
jgi:predicted Zn-dependent protease